MNQHTNMNSFTAPTPQINNTDRSHQHFNQQPTHTKNAPNPTLVLGPITRKKRDETNTAQNREKKSEAPKPDHQQRQVNLEVEKDPATVKLKALRIIFILLDAVLITIIVIILFPFKFIALYLQDLWDGWCKLSSMSYVVDASPIEIEPWNNSTLHAMVKYATMTIYPFLFFVPSLVMLSAAIASLTDEEEDAERIIGRNTVTVQANPERRNGRKRTLKFMSMSTALLFLFMSAMLACAETSRWIMLGLISGVTPALLILLARLSVVYAGDSYGYAGVRLGGCSNGLSWCSIVEISKAAKLIGFVFAILPFVAGFFYVISPPYLLAVPLSSLTTCTIAGIFGAAPLIISIVCIMLWWTTTNWILTKLFGIYSWFVKTNCSMLLFLTCIALLMTAGGLRQVPSYM